MSGPWISSKEIKIINDVMKNGWYGDKKYYYVETFEKEFAKFHGRKYGLMTTNCTQAIQLLLHSLGVKKGDNVINQECTWVAAAAAVSYTGAKNNFCDIDKDNWCLSANSLKQNINKNTKAVIVSNIYGNMANMDEISNICKKNKIFLIEDAAESLGSIRNKKRAGSNGIASVFSFHRTKTITTGEGGMLVTNNKKLFELCKFFRDQGRNKTNSYNIDELGFKFMPFNLQAALGYSQFKRLKEIVEKKRWIFESYRKYFKNFDVQFNLENKNFFNGCWATTIVISKKYKKNTKTLMKILSDKKLPVRPFFLPLSSMKPFYNKFSIKKNRTAYDIYKRGLTLPSALNLKKNQIAMYSDAIKSILDS